MGTLRAVYLLIERLNRKTPMSSALGPHLQPRRLKAHPIVNALADTFAVLLTIAACTLLFLFGMLSNTTRTGGPVVVLDDGETWWVPMVLLSLSCGVGLTVDLYADMHRRRHRGSPSRIRADLARRQADRAHRRASRRILRMRNITP